MGTPIANAFRHSIMRSLVGAIIPVGTEAESMGWPVEVLRDRQRHSEVTVMPALGLCLEEIVYPSDDLVAARA